MARRTVTFADQVSQDEWWVSVVQKLINENDVNILPTLREQLGVENEELVERIRNFRARRAVADLRGDSAADVVVEGVYDNLYTGLANKILSDPTKDAYVAQLKTLEAVPEADFENYENAVDNVSRAFGYGLSGDEVNALAVELRKKAGLEIGQYEESDEGREDLYGAVVAAAKGIVEKRKAAVAAAGGYLDFEVGAETEADIAYDGAVERYFAELAKDEIDAVKLDTAFVTLNRKYVEKLAQGLGVGVSGVGGDANVDDDEGTKPLITLTKRRPPAQNQAPASGATRNPLKVVGNAAVALGRRFGRIVSGDSSAATVNQPPVPPSAARAAQGAAAAARDRGSNRSSTSSGSSGSTTTTSSSEGGDSVGDLPPAAMPQPAGRRNSALDPLPQPPAAPAAGRSESELQRSGALLSLMNYCNRGEPNAQDIMRAIGVMQKAKREEEDRKHKTLKATQRKEILAQRKRPILGDDNRLASKITLLELEAAVVEIKNHYELVDGSRADDMYDALVFATDEDGTQPARPVAPQEVSGFSNVAYKEGSAASAVVPTFMIPGEGGSKKAATAPATVSAQFLRVPVVQKITNFEILVRELKALIPPARKDANSQASNVFITPAQKQIAGILHDICGVAAGSDALRDPNIALARQKLVEACTNALTAPNFDQTFQDFYKLARFVLRSFDRIVNGEVEFSGAQVMAGSGVAVNPVAQQGAGAAVVTHVYQYMPQSPEGGEELPQGDAPDADLNQLPPESDGEEESAKGNEEMAKLLQALHKELHKEDPDAFNKFKRIISGNEDEPEPTYGRASAGVSGAAVGGQLSAISADRANVTIRARLNQVGGVADDALAKARRDLLLAEIQRALAAEDADFELDDEVERVMDNYLAVEDDAENYPQVRVQQEASLDALLQHLERKRQGAARAFVTSLEPNYDFAVAGAAVGGFGDGEDDESLLPDPNDEYLDTFDVAMDNLGAQVEEYLSVEGDNNLRSALLKAGFTAEYLDSLEELTDFESGYLAVDPTVDPAGEEYLDVEAGVTWHHEFIKTQIDDNDRHLIIKSLEERLRAAGTTTYDISSAGATPSATTPAVSLDARKKLTVDMVKKMQANMEEQSEKEEIVDNKRDQDYFVRAQAHLKTITKYPDDAQKLQLNQIIFDAIVNAEVDGAQQCCEEVLKVFGKPKVVTPPVEPPVSSSSSSFTPKSSSSSSFAPKGSSSAAAAPKVTILPPQLTPPQLGVPAAPAAAKAPAISAPSISGALKIRATTGPIPNYRSVLAMPSIPHPKSKFSKLSDEQINELAAQLLVIAAGNKLNPIKNVAPEYLPLLPNHKDNQAFAILFNEITGLGKSGRMLQDTQYSKTGVVDIRGLPANYLRDALEVAFERSNTTNLAQGAGGVKLKGASLGRVA